ncbi:TspO/MBR family protein [Zongyangia hominis]|uniref:Tryptophan-rich sensory protein n=1 Tax=Zongyangia hominis TaxID=2763677 RepID=A0A926I9L5_9FIRM|nr:TspO/MBR family protein [Zongyangia hominis]MBC8569281.1 tryptophan-rich sensory protein [Zongyangia hominis]
MKKQFRWGPFLVFVLLTLGIGTAVGMITNPAQAYGEFVQPPLSPPNWVFPVAWTILYLLLALAATLVYCSDAPREQKRNALIWYGINLLLNFSWTPVFFGLRQPLTAFVILVLLLIVTVVLLVSFYRIRPAAGYLLIPYLAWLLFAGYLNFGIYLLNR